MAVYQSNLLLCLYVQANGPILSGHQQLIMSWNVECGMLNEICLRLEYSHSSFHIPHSTIIHRATGRTPYHSHHGTWHRECESSAVLLRRVLVAKECSAPQTRAWHQQGQAGRTRCGSSSWPAPPSSACGKPFAGQRVDASLPLC